uniref:Putative homing endonuclease n=1 Tax=viral metagenome TaxID=1070528 RepID=A0A6H2A2S6_9ZZZZ
MRPETKAAYPKNWREISLEIRGSRNYTCEGCGQYGSRPGNPLTVHHIDYNPANNPPGNLLLLCAKCHLKVQAKHYPSLLLIKYGQAKLF